MLCSFFAKRKTAGLWAKTGPGRGLFVFCAENHWKSGRAACTMQKEAARFCREKDESGG